MSEAALAKPGKEKKPVKKQIIELFLLCVILMFIVLIVYICLDANIDREYGLGESEIQFDTSYKERFGKLVTDVEEGNSTGIPTIDDAGVMYGTRVDITKGVGDFSSIKSNWDTNLKTFTWYNAYGGSYNPINWSTSSNQYTFAYSKLLHQKATLYARSGVVKIYDRYAMVALGTYWSKKLGLPKDQGATYRVYMDNGKTFDIICFDVAATGDSNSVNSNNGTSLGHSYNGNVVITEFDLLNLEHNYPVLAKQNATHPEMRYEELMTLKDDPSHVKLSGGTLNVIPEFEGNVVALQLIDDPKVKDLLNQATEEVKKYK